ncbi:hypothetical protein OSB04_024760 [Centaurea solstitialis]|uniref:Replication factor A C-terminal domain-containing protein n=1 Tax=Centaurea solstitialis TaxID=347529 RepID=A0AA38SMD7_9ASTR|nr:hypothetical protein OSB04_024760 [Centaurea solstitialis]
MTYNIGHGNPCYCIAHNPFNMHTFQQYKRYYISNAVVIRNQAKYVVGPYQFSWVLNNRTLVEEISDPIPLMLPCKFNFTPFNKLHKYAESDIYQDVRGIVVHCLPTYDQGPDLATRRDIIFHKAEVQELFETKDFKNNHLLLPYPIHEDITPITKVVDSFGTLKSSWVTDELSLPMQERGFFYTGCANCHKAVEADTTWIVNCPSCKTESEIIAMSRMLVTIEDSTGSIQATIYTANVEKFIPFTSTKLKEAEENYRGMKQTRVNIIKAYSPKKTPVHTKSTPRYDMSQATTHESPSEEKHASTSQPISVTTEKLIVSDMKEARPMKKPNWVFSVRNSKVKGSGQNLVSPECIAI